MKNKNNELLIIGSIFIVIVLGIIVWSIIPSTTTTDSDDPENTHPTSKLLDKYDKKPTYDSKHDYYNVILEEINTNEKLSTTRDVWRLRLQKKYANTISDKIVSICGESSLNRPQYDKIKAHANSFLGEIENKENLEAEYQLLEKRELSLRRFARGIEALPQLLTQYFSSSKAFTQADYLEFTKGISYIKSDELVSKNKNIMANLGKMDTDLVRLKRDIDNYESFNKQAKHSNESDITDLINAKCFDYFESPYYLNECENIRFKAYDNYFTKRANSVYLHDTILSAIPCHLIKNAEDSKALLRQGRGDSFYTDCLKLKSR